MSPHGIVLLAALLCGFVGKLIFPNSTLRIVGASALALPVAAAAYLREPPSVIGLLIILPLGLLGAALRVGGSSIVVRNWQARKHEK